MPNKKMQLFILPYAGGSIAAFKRITDLIDERIDVVTVEYAGRGTRAKDPLADSMETLLKDVADYCNERRQNDLPYAVMGYSMGSVMAYELMMREAIPGQLKHLFIAAEVSPKERALELRKLHNPSTEQVLERARRLGGLNMRIAKDKRFADIYLRPMIADYKRFFEYQFHNYNKKLVTDCTVFYCEKDTSYKDVEKWTELITGIIDFHELGNNHFFINSHYETMANVINDHLMKYL